ncbi:MAG: hypothetical protein HN366_27950, partial [Deltaproteobacteria bacterium]|nr:hypothetical protein [Deltaproteobacteria bacterium]
MQHALKNAIALLGILALLAGCSFSYSSGASSDSSGTSSDSSKSSSASSGASESDPKDARRTY